MGDDSWDRPCPFGNLIMAKVLVVEKPNAASSIREILAAGRRMSSVHAAQADEVQDRLSAEDFEILLVDIDGIPDSREWLEAVREQQPDLPIVLVSADSPHTSGTVKALILGAASFVPRNRMSRDLALTVERVVALCCPEETAPVGTLLRQTRHDYRLGNDRKEIVPVVRHLATEFDRFEICRRADRVRVSVAIEEALVNAIVHGNLEIPSELRERGDDAYETGIATRRGQPPYQERRVHVWAALTDEKATVVIRDEGPGFDPADVPDPTDPENLAKPHGRGLLLMRAFMDEVTYNDAGNEVTLVKQRVEGGRA